jgi:hypothetical protein
MTKMYYGPNESQSSNYRLSPAPQISVRTEPNYSGDVIIGYVHTVSMRGYATAYRKLNTTEPTHSVSSIGLVADNISAVKKILTYNGGNLSVTEDDGTEIMKCIGGTVRSLSFNESPNNWMGYAEYSAEIEFNEVQLVSGGSLKDIACSDSYIDSGSLSSSVVDISQYKIKSFSDNLSLNIDENIYSKILNTDFQNMETDNSSMSVTYTISATGKNNYIDNKLIPAWEQAKNFAQEKLVSKIQGLLTSAFGITASTACAASSSVSGVGSSTDGILSNLNGQYKVYNETISCTTSESDGSFSLTYNGLIKRNYTSATNHPASRHTFTKTRNIQNDTKKIISISVQGTLEGLIEGGAVQAAGSGFKLPNNGSILISTNNVDKYTNALAGLNKIIGGADLTQDVKEKLGIDIASLGISQAQINQCGKSPDDVVIPSSFSLTHNYHEGIINYSVDYSSDAVCGQNAGLSSVSISVENPAPVLAEIPVPGSPLFIIQDINTVTPKRISINIEGRSERSCCLNEAGVESLISSAGFSVPQGISLPSETSYVLTQKQRTDNPISGTFTISLGYMCVPGC